MNLQENISRIKEVMGLDDLEYTEPNSDLEWGEAERYIDHEDVNKRIGWTKKEWMDKIKDGKVIRYSDIPKLENVSDVSEFESLLPEKIERFIKAISERKLEMPIVVKFPNNVYDLVAGNTRLTGALKNGYNPKIWLIEL